MCVFRSIYGESVTKDCTRDIQRKSHVCLIYLRTSITWMQCTRGQTRKSYSLLAKGTMFSTPTISNRVIQNH